MSTTISSLQRLIGLVLALTVRVPLSAAPWLTFTEISYHPKGDEALEFVEIYNLEAPHVDLTGWKLEGQVEFAFPEGLRLPPRQCVVVARDVAAFRKRYPGAASVVGPYHGDFDNEGGRLRLLNRVGATAAKMRYGSSGEWSTVPDGTGHSLVLADAFFDPSDPTSWRPSLTPGGSPGVYEPPGSIPSREPGSGSASEQATKRSAKPAAATARLNEVALETKNGITQLRWVELHNPTPSPIDLGGHLLSDDAERPSRWKIPSGTVAAAGGLVVLSRDELRAKSLVGPTIFLTAPDGHRVVDALSTRGLHEGELVGSASFGRYPDGATRCWRLSKETPAAPNELLASRDIVINEIGYHSTGVDETDEYIELHNPGSTNLSLNGLRLRQGVRYDFKAGDTIKPGGYLVVARSPEALSRQHGISRRLVVGPFAGQLSNRGEEIWLCDQHGRIVDLVSYADRSPWPDPADGWGSSLELIDPRIDNALPGAWAASDERSKTSWQSITYEGHVYLFSGMRASSFQFLLLDAGECLIDDLLIVDTEGRPVIEESFDGGASGWNAFGTHLDSSVMPPGPYSTTPCYRIVATGRGNTRHNYVSLSLDRALPEGAKYTVSFRVRWMSGCALLLSRTAGQGLAKAHRLRIPDARGTPGRRNSRAVTAGPIVGVPTQLPVAPRTDEPVRIEAPITARTDIESAEVRYRHERESQWRSVPLTRLDSRRWTATIPPQSGGRVAFAIFARDSSGRVGAFPRAGTDRPALFAVNLSAARLPTYHVLISDREFQASRGRQRMSNRLMDATLVYGTSRIFYNVGFRLRGSGFTRGDGNWRLVFGAETLDGRHELTFDGQGRNSMLSERATFWLLDQIDVPTPRQRYVYLNVHGPGQENGVYEEVEKVNGDFLARWFSKEEGVEERPRNLHKIDDYWDFRPPDVDEDDSYRGRRGFGRRGFGRRGGSYAEAYMSYRTSDPEDYRWNFPARANGTDEDFAPLIDLIRLVDPEITFDAVFRERVESLVAVDEWTRVLAGRTVANDYDTYGLRRGKNAYLYRAPSGRWHLLPWDSDLSWRSRGFGRSRSASLFSDKFPAIQRLLGQPSYRRMFLGHVAFLASKRLEPKSFSRIADELAKHAGVPAYDLEYAAASNRERLLEEIPVVALRVQDVQRMARPGKPDILRVSGTAPVITHAFRLGGRAGTARFPDERTFTAEFEVGPEDGEVVLRAIDRDGDEVARTTVTVPR